MKRVYLDHNATTPMREEVRAHLRDKMTELEGNPSSVHRTGRRARAALDDARARTAAALGVHEDEVFFTSGGTESVNLALLGASRARGKAGFLTSTAEHSCVLGAADALADRGVPVHRIGVDSRCRVDPEEALELAARAEVGLVSVMTANNEVGTLQPLGIIGAGLDSHQREKALFHTDAVQALGRIPVRLDEWRIDLASVSAHKVGGPLGVGVLFKRRGLQLAPLMHGGGQEAGLRPGSENVPAISAASLAFELAVREREESASRIRELSLMLWHELAATLPDVELLGPPIESNGRLPNTLEIVVGGIDGRMLVARLDLEGLEVSAGSACASGSLEPSHVLLAMGRSVESARSGLRLSLGRESNREDIHTAVEILKRAVSDLR
ncbi:MAG: cysteine desulfurase family protein [Planctomycetota bacterium]